MPVSNVSVCSTTVTYHVGWLREVQCFFFLPNRGTKQEEREARRPWTSRRFQNKGSALGICTAPARLLLLGDPGCCCLVTVVLDSQPLPFDMAAVNMPESAPVSEQIPAKSNVQMIKINLAPLVGTLLCLVTAARAWSQRR